MQRPKRPIEPPHTGWKFPSPVDAPEDLVAIGADLEPGTLLAAYRAGYFPMKVGGGLGWWSPDPRGILPLDGLHVSRSLRRSLRRFEFTMDRSFTDVMWACADRDDGNWIDEEFVAAYTALHDLGWAHSFEVRLDGRLVGGVYGVAIGGLFAGESMFHRETDAGKVALVHAVDRLRERGCRLFDVQWQTRHLATLGVVEVPRTRYLDLLAAALHDV